jgi:hypothetical protein
MEHDLRANALSRLLRGKAGAGFPNKSCSNQTAGAGQLSEEKAVPRWKHVLESTREWGLVACSGRVW